MLEFLLGLAASLTAGTASEYVRRAATGSGANAGSPMMSEANVGRLVDKLSRMRGAALKLGQFLSIQGTFKSVAVICVHKHQHFTRCACST